MLRAAADLIVERGLDALSLARVAERAGVSKRTLYTYFDSREALLDDLFHWSEELTLELGGALIPAGLDTLPDVAKNLWHAWDEQGTLHQAIVMIDAATHDDGPSAGRRARHDALARGVADLRPDLSADVADHLGSAFHAVVSAPVFERLTAQDGLDTDTAAELVSWMVSAMRDALAAKRDPDLPVTSNA